LEIKQRAQRDMTFLILAFTYILAAKKQNFYGEKIGFRCLSKIQYTDFSQNMLTIYVT